MSDLLDLLERAAGPGGGPVDATADLTRGRRGLARTRSRRSATGLAGLAAVCVLGVALTRGGDDGAAPPVASDDGTPTAAPTAAPPTVPPPTTSPTTAPTVDPSAPVTGSADPTFFDVPPAPDGWEVQGSSPYGVVFARPGSTTVPDDFEGKIVLMFSANKIAGEERSVEGRSFWVADTGDGYSRVTTVTRGDEPRGRLELQFPSEAWTPEQAISFLSGVRALAGAEASSG